MNLSLKLSTSVVFVCLFSDKEDDDDDDDSGDEQTMRDDDKPLSI